MGNFLSNFTSILTAAFGLFGAFQTLQYDVIVVGSGAGGCPLAQTLADGGLKVLLLERGGEAPESGETALTFGNVLLSNCIESFDSDGVVASTGNCLGGATSLNQGIHIEPDTQWLRDNMPGINSADIEAAFDWVGDKVSPVPTAEPAGSAAEAFIDALGASYASNGIPLVNPDPGQRQLVYGGAWRGHSIFENAYPRKRRSAETILDRDHPNLTIRLNAKVNNVHYDGGFLIPFSARFPKKNTPRARCVQLDSLEMICVKKEGRVYLAAGAFHTPELLMKSGIGNKGSVVDNPDVGQHLQDKPVAPAVGFFKPEFNYNGLITVSHLPATKEFTTDDGDSAFGLYEEISTGIPDQYFDLIFFEKVYTDRSGRFTLQGDIIGNVLRFCLRGEGIIPGVLNIVNLCDGINAVVEAGCTQKIVILASILSQPTSKGSVSIVNGKLRVNVNYMGTSRDRKALFLAFKTGQDILAGLTGAATFEQSGPGKCPTLFSDSVRANTANLPPDSQFIPSISTDDQKEGGDILAERILAGHHFAGTAALGKVVDNRFRVLGTEGLYVADASVLPITPPVNPMASTLMIGRLAGMFAVDEM